MQKNFHAFYQAKVCDKNRKACSCSVATPRPTTLIYLASICEKKAEQAPLWKKIFNEARAGDQQNE
jgi:hypothetical protein